MNLLNESRQSLLATHNVGKPQRAAKPTTDWTLATLRIRYTYKTLLSQHRQGTHSFKTLPVETHSQQLTFDFDSWRFGGASAGAGCRVQVSQMTDERSAVCNERVPERRLRPQSVVARLVARETWGSRRPGAHWQVAREFYQTVFPNCTVVNVEKPPCFLRKFSPDGAHFIAFSADQTSLEVSLFSLFIVLSFMCGSHFFGQYFNIKTVSVFIGNICIIRSRRNILTKRNFSEYVTFNFLFV